MRFRNLCVGCLAFLVLACSDSPPTTPKEGVPVPVGKGSVPAPEPKEDGPSLEGKTLAAWITLLREGATFQDRFKAAQVLGKFDFKDADHLRDRTLAALGQALRDENMTVRLFATESLRGHGQHAIPVYLEALKDKNVEVRRSVISELGRVRSWEHGDRGWPGSAVRREGAFPIRLDSIIPALAEVLGKDKDPDVRRSAASALASIGRDFPDAGKPAISALTVAVQAGDAETRKWAIFGLGDLGDMAGAALPALLAAARAEDAGGEIARSVLQKIHKAPRSSAPALIPFLKDPEPLIRLKAIEVLCELEIADKECLAVLLELIKRRDSTIRRDAALLLTRYGSAAKDAVPALIEIVRNDLTPQTRLNAIVALGAIGPAAKDAIPALKVAQEDQLLKVSAQSALKKIDQ
jgi:HEAT repeat protein